MEKIWNWLSINFFEQGRSIAIYGAGKFTKDLLNVNINTETQSSVSLIIDDNPTEDFIEKIPVYKISEAKKHNNFTDLLIGSDSFEAEIKEKCLASKFLSEKTLIGISDITDYLYQSSNSNQTFYLSGGDFKSAEMNLIGNSKIKIAIHLNSSSCSQLQIALSYLKNIKCEYKLLLSLHKKSSYIEACEILAKNNINDFSIKFSKNKNSVDAILSNFKDIIKEFNFLCNIDLTQTFPVESNRIIENALKNLLGSPKSIRSIWEKMYLNNNLSACFSDELDSEPDLKQKYKIASDKARSYIDEVIRNSDIVKEISTNKVLLSSPSFFWINSNLISQLIRETSKLFAFNTKDQKALHFTYSEIMYRLLNSYGFVSSNVKYVYENIKLEQNEKLITNPKIIAFYNLDEYEDNLNKPSFTGHKQPRKRLFYTTPNSNTMNDDISLASSSGINAFAINIYWTGNQFLNLTKINQPLFENNNFEFCLSLTGITENSDDAIKDIKRFLCSNSYLKIGEKAILILRSNFPEKVIKKWIKECFESGIKLHIISNAEYEKSPLHNSQLENPLSNEVLNSIPNISKYFNSSFEENNLIINYQELAKYHKRKVLERGIYKTVLSMWDDSAYKKQKKTIIHEYTPAEFEKWLAHSINYTLTHMSKEESLIFIQSWNDWKHCSYLAPDHDFGYAYLNATLRAKTNPWPWKTLKAPVSKGQTLVSIVIPCFNNWSYTFNCLQSIICNTKRIEYEIILGDDLSTDETIFAKKYLENITVVRHSKNLGFVRNCNEAAKYAKGKYLMFLNNDTYVKNGAIEELAKLLDNDTSIGLTGSKLVYKNNTLQEAGGVVFQDGSGWNYGRMDEPNLPQYNYTKDVDYISGASIMIRKNLWEEIGGFDELFCPAYYEDTDLAFQVRSHGYRVVYQPKSEVIHYEGITCGTDINSDIKRFQEINKHKFVKKNRHALKDQSNNENQLFTARDRSQKKSVVLVIDHYVPTFDKDAGSRNMFACLQSLIELGYAVKFIGDNFCKMDPYTAILEGMGIEVLYGHHYSAGKWKDWLIKNKDYIDFVYLHRPHIAIKYINTIKEHSCAKIIYNVADLHFKRLSDEAKLYNRKETREEAEKFKKMEFEIIQKSDLIFSVSTDEVEFISKTWPLSIPKWLPIFTQKSYFNSEVFNKKYEERNGILFIGSYFHGPNKNAIDWFIENVFKNLIKESPKIHLHIVGKGHEVTSKYEENITLHGYLSDAQLSKLYNDVKIAIIPLQYGAGLKGKTLEALFNKVPIVGTSCAIEGFPEKNTIFRAYDTPEEFLNRVLELYNDKLLWDSERNKYGPYINKYFSTNNLNEIIKRAFSKS